MPTPRNSRSASRPRRGNRHRADAAARLLRPWRLRRRSAAGGAAAFPERCRRAILASLEGARKAVAALDDAVVGIAPHSLRAVTPESLARCVGDCRERAGPYPRRRAGEGGRGMRRLVGPAPGRVASRSMRRSTERWCLIHATHLDAPTRVAARREWRGCGTLSDHRGQSRRRDLSKASTYLAAGGASGSAPIPTSRSRRRASSSSSSTASVWRTARNVLAPREGQSTGHASTRMRWQAALRRSDGASAAWRRLPRGYRCARREPPGPHRRHGRPVDRCLHLRDRTERDCIRSRRGRAGGRARTTPRQIFPSATIYFSP